MLKMKEEYFSKALQVLKIPVSNSLPPSSTSNWHGPRLHNKQPKMEGRHNNDVSERCVQELEERIEETDQNIESNPCWVILRIGFQVIFSAVAITTMLHVVYLLMVTVIFIIQLVKYRCTKFILLLLIQNGIGTQYTYLDTRMTINLCQHNM